MFGERDEIEGVGLGRMEENKKEAEKPAEEEVREPSH